MLEGMEIRVDADGNIHAVAVDEDGLDSYEVECVAVDDEFAPQE